VARGYVRDFVRITPASSASVSAFRMRPEFTKKKPPGSAKAFTSSEIQHLDRERNFGVRVPDNVLTHAVHVLRNDRVVDDLRLALHLLRQLFAESDLLLQRVEVYALANVTVANRFGIFLFILAKAPAASRPSAARTATGTAEGRLIFRQLLIVTLYAYSGRGKTLP